MWLYTGFFTLIMPLVLLRLWWRGLKAPAYRQRIGERFAHFKAPQAKNGVWFHCVSVGETLAALPLIRTFMREHPEIPVTITTTTPTGSERVRAALGDEVFHVYAPYDLPWLVKRFLKKVRPRALVIMETELWPNTIGACHHNKVPVMLANARLSRRSARGYRRMAWLTRPMLQQLSYIGCQFAKDARRFSALGAAKRAVHVTGSVKFDFVPPENLAQQADSLFSFWDDQLPVWVAASTHEGEDEVLLSMHRKVQEALPEAKFILVPRHPERFDAVAQLATRRGFLVVRRSQLAEEAEDVENQATLVERKAQADVFLCDSMGELMICLERAQVAFVGGSLIPRGGHNPLEPAAVMTPVISGIHVFNFSEIYRQLVKAKGAYLSDDSERLSQRIVTLLQHPELASQKAQAAYEVLTRNRGAVARTLGLLNKMLAEHEKK